MHWLVARLCNLEDQRLHLLELPETSGRYLPTIRSVKIQAQHNDFKHLENKLFGFQAIFISA